MCQLHKSVIGSEARNLIIRSCATATFASSDHKCSICYQFVIELNSPALGLGANKLIFKLT